MDIHEPHYETLISSDDDLLTMSRLNWMTYLKVLFDKLLQSNNSFQEQNNNIDLEVDIYQLLEALSQIKNLLPLMTQHEYMSKYANEKGFTVHEVEFSLKKFLIINRTTQLSWDDVIDMFLCNKTTKKSQNTNQTKKVTQGGTHILMEAHEDDLVNVSSEEMCNVDDEFKIDNTIKGKNSNSKEKASENFKSEQNVSQDFEGSPKFSPYWQQKEINLQGFAENNNYNHRCHSLVEESPPVDKIVKKIDFKDTLTTNEKRHSNELKTSPKLSKQRNDSKATLGGTNQNCSFYLTPSSAGMQTPLQTNQTNKPGTYQMLIMNSENQSPSIITNDKQNTKRDSNNSFNKTQNSIRDSSRIFSYQIPYESAANSSLKQRLNMQQRKLFNLNQIISDERYYDINYSNMKCVSSMQMPTSGLIKRDCNSSLRSINLSKNMFSRIYMLHPLQAQQLLILNMSFNLIQNINGIEQCQNLQFLNLSHNMITDISPLSSLRSLQEVFLSHNLISSLLIKYSDNEIVWQHLEILDLTQNKLNDFYEILQLLNGSILRKQIIRMIGLKGNSFYNQFDTDHKCINFEAEEHEIVDHFSNYASIPILFKQCFGSNENQTQNALGSLQRQSLQLQPFNAFSLCFNNHTFAERPSITNQQFSQSPVMPQLHQKHQSMIHQQQQQSKILTRGMSKTRMDYLPSDRSPSQQQMFKVSRSVSRDRPITQLHSSQQYIHFTNRLQSSISFSTNQNQRPQFNKTISTSQTRGHGSYSRTKQSSSISQNYNTNQCNPKSMSKNFKQAVTVLSNKLSLKEKQKTINYTKIEKPLSRNVKFFDFGLTTKNKAAANETTNNINNNSSNFNQSKSSLSINAPNSGAHNYHNQNTKIANQKQQCQKQKEQQTKRASLNNQLKKSIDLQFGIQSTKPNLSLVKQMPNTTKHGSSNSMSFQQNPVYGSANIHKTPSQTPKAALIPSITLNLSHNNTSTGKRKQTTPIKPLKVSSSSGYIPQKIDRHSVNRKQIKDIHCEVEDEEVPIVVMEENASDEDSKEREISSHSEYSSTDEKENSSTNINKIKAETFIFRENAVVKKMNKLSMGSINKKFPSNQSSARSQYQSKPSNLKKLL